MVSIKDSSADTSSVSNMWSTDLIVAVAALIVIAVTLIFIVLQILLQGLSLASGYSNCSKKVMGLWAKNTKLKLNWMRPEVHFDAPVIFIAPPGNTRAPVPKQKIWVINGSPGSCAETKIELNEEKRQIQVGDEIGLKVDESNFGHVHTAESERATWLTRLSAWQPMKRQPPEVDLENGTKDNGSNFEPIHTADSERATWLKLLSALQLMEHDSIKWQADQYIEKEQFLKDWQNDPQKHDNDQVNIQGTPHTPSAGGWGKRTLSVAIQSKTRSWYTVPDNVKKPYATTTLCHLVEMAAILGLHWREFNQDSDRYRADGNGYALSGAMHADFGLMFSFHQVGDTKFEENRLIPVNEIKELCFGYVPTMLRKEAGISSLKWPLDAEKAPTVVHTLQLGSPQGFIETLASIGCNMNTQHYFSDPLKRRGHLFPVAFELIGMLAPPLHIKKTSFRMLPNPTFSNWDSKALNLSGLLAAFKKYAQKPETINAQLGAGVGDKLYVNTVIAFCDSIEQKRQESLSEHPHEFLDELHKTIDKLDEFLYENGAPIIKIVRRHVDEVMKKLNGDKNDKLLKLLDEGSPERKVDALMQIYFEPVRKAARGGTSEQENGAQEQSGTAAAAAKDASADPASPTSPSSPQSQHQMPQLDALVADEIWCKLILRMLCWLMLHDFNKRDVQLYTNPKSELLGSRLPVYII